MKGVYAALSVFVALAQANSDIVTLYANKAYIQEANATLVLPELPNPVTGDVALWSAIMMQNEASFIQGVTSNSPSGDGGKNWCNFAYTLVRLDATVGKGVTASPGSTVKTHYKLNSTTQLWDQNVYIDGKLLSTVSTSKSQHGNIFYISIECAAGNCASHPAHSWENVTVVLSEANEKFKHTGNWAHGATGGNMSTPDEGKTWEFTTINIPAQKAM